MISSTTRISIRYLKGRIPNVIKTMKKTSERTTVIRAITRATGKISFLLFLYAIRRAFSSLVNCGFSDISCSSWATVYYTISSVSKHRSKKVNLLIAGKKYDKMMLKENE
jgi:CTP synthase (UTP-ammonia lyase)